MNNIKRIFSQPLKIGGILGGVFGFVSDFLQPLAEVGYIIATVCLVIILLTLIIKAIPPLDNYLHQKHNNIWYAPLFVTLSTFCIILSIANYASLNYGNNQQGILATNSTFINKIQNKLISIEQSLDTIQESQKQAHNKLDTLNQEQRSISQTIHLNIEQLKQSILSGNIDAVINFHTQGGDLNILKNSPPGYVGWNEAIIVSLVKNKNKNTVNILDYILKNTSINPDSLFPINNFGNRLSDAYISMLQDDNLKKNKAYENANSSCLEEHKKLLKLNSEKLQEFNISLCVKENTDLLLKNENLNLQEFSELKLAMNSLIDEAYQAENIEAVNYLKGKGVTIRKEGLLILKSGIEIKIPSSIKN